MGASSPFTLSDRGIVQSVKLLSTKTTGHGFEPQQLHLR